MVSSELLNESRNYAMASFEHKNSSYGAAIGTRPLGDPSLILEVQLSTAEQDSKHINAGGVNTLGSDKTMSHDM